MSLIFNNVLFRFVLEYVVLYLQTFEIGMVTIRWNLKLTDCEIQFKRVDSFLGGKFM